MSTIYQAFLTFADAAAPAAQQGAPAGGGLGSLWIFLPNLQNLVAEFGTYSWVVLCKNIFCLNINKAF